MHSDHRLSHDENRTKVCAICMEKCKYKITESILERIQQYFISNYNLHDDRLPTGICGKCRADLSDIHYGKKDITVLPESFDYSQINPLFSTATRSNTSGITMCDCLICCTARQSGNLQKRTPGPKSSCIATNFQSAQKVVRLCFICKSPIGRGISHTCSKHTKLSNIENMCETLDSRSQEILGGNILKRTMDPVTKECQLATRGPKKLTVKVGSSSSDICHKKILATDVSKLQVCIGASNNNMTRQILPFLRNMHGRSCIESNAARILSSRDKTLLNYFQCQTISFESKKETVHSAPVVYCPNTSELINFICDRRNINSETVSFGKFGIDSGGGFIKICLNLITQEATFQQLMSWEKDFVSGGVKKLIIIAMAPDVSETNSNMKSILNLIGLDNVDISYTYAVDLKLANILAGIQAHGSTHPCVWCECPKSKFGTSESKKAILRSLGSIRAQAAAYNRCKEMYGNAQAKDYKNSVHDPLFIGDDSQIFIRLMPPSELHLMLRITNRVYKSLENLFPIPSSQFIQRLNIERPKLHGGEFTGNMCRKILKNVNLLKAIGEQSHCSEEFFMHVHIFEAFDVVVKSCFGKTLSSSFRDDIEALRKSYMAINIPVTTAAHVVFDHVPQFCLYTHSSLGPYSEQASETVHTDFLQMWNNGKRTNPSSSNYNQQLCDAVVRYNSRHL
jgi:hypothetical protein